MDMSNPYARSKTLFTSRTSSMPPNIRLTWANRFDWTRSNCLRASSPTGLHDLRNCPSSDGVFPLARKDADPNRRQASSVSHLSSVPHKPLVQGIGVGHNHPPNGRG